jgi:hypothetical protein
MHAKGHLQVRAYMTAPSTEEVVSASSRAVHDYEYI